MTRFQLLIHSLAYYWRNNLAVLLGVAAATAVIGGALIVGDSVRGSLRQMTLDRLGNVDHVLRGGRFFREELAGILADDPEFRQRFAAAAPALAMQGSLQFHADAESSRRAGGVQIIGVDNRAWRLLDAGALQPPGDNDIYLSAQVADQLGLHSADLPSADAVTGVDVAIALFVELPSAIPRDALLGQRDESSREIQLRLTKESILTESSLLGRFSLEANQRMPLVAFVSLSRLQEELDLAEVKAGPRSEAVPARVNTVFVQGQQQDDRDGPGAVAAAQALTQIAARHLELDDLGLTLPVNNERGYLSLESRQQILDDGFARAAEAAARSLGMKTSPVFVYLANELANVKRPDAFSMYSVVAGIDLEALREQPFGSWVFTEPPQSPQLGPNQILLTDWLRDDLEAQRGDKVCLAYHLVGSHGELPEEIREFEVAGVVKLDGTPADDRTLTPTVKGITDATTISGWRQPFEMKMDRITDRDEEYWEKYRATPKAYVSLATAQQLWQSKYGKLTSLRIAPGDGQSLEQAMAAFSQAALERIPAEQSGIVFTPVRYDGLKAASGTTPFSALFLSFSFFLILSATILIGLLLRLGIERRGSQVGLLLALGFKPAHVRRLFLFEGFLLVCAGGLVGIPAAVGYAELMVYGLKTWWSGAIGTRLLDVYIAPGSLAIGFGISLAVALLAVWWSLRHFSTTSARMLLAGATGDDDFANRSRRARMPRIIAAGGALAAGAVLLLIAFHVYPAGDALPGVSWNVLAFFVVGMALLSAGVAGLSAWLDSDQSAAVRGAGLLGLVRLALRNASRHRKRSVMTVGSIASAAFVIVAVAAGHRNPTVETPDINSGNGGFTLVAESTAPILYDLNTPQGRSKLNLPSAAGLNDEKSTDTDRASLLERMHIVAFRVRSGEDASCLNIYQTQLPKVLGAPKSLIDRGGFRFIGADAGNPWTLLDEQLEPETRGTSSIPVVPVFGDYNTLQFSLHKGPGDTIAVPATGQPQYLLKVAGMFDGSVLQGVLVMSEANFERVFPDEPAGYRYFLVECPPADAARATTLLETGLADYGLDAERVTDRLARFLAVQNTYLSTFQTLGGLGLLLGTFGLATVMLRNVVERRSELALLRAVGFRNASIAALVVFENAFLLVWGLAVGTASALLAMTPHLVRTGADVPWLSGSAMLLAILVVGTLSALFAVAEAVRTEVLATLWSE